MKTLFTVRGFMALSDPDTYNEGCDPYKSKSYFEPDFRLSANSLSELLEGLRTKFCAKNNDLTFDACEEPGRLDIQVYQREPFVVSKLSAKTIEDWQGGRRVLWLTNYIFQVVIEQHDVTLTKVEAGELPEELP